MPTGSRIRELRLQRGLTQQALADRLHRLAPHMFPRWNHANIGRIERGERGLQFDQATYVARALECTLEDLRDPNEL